MTELLYMANELNNHFTTLAKRMETKLIKPKLHFPYYLSETVEETLTFRLTDELELTSINNSLNDFLVKLFKNKLSNPFHC